MATCSKMRTEVRAGHRSHNGSTIQRRILKPLSAGICARTICHLFKTHKPFHVSCECIRHLRGNIAGQCGIRREVPRRGNDDSGTRHPSFLGDTPQPPAISADGRLVHLSARPATWWQTMPMGGRTSSCAICRPGTTTLGQCQSGRNG